MASSGPGGQLYDPIRKAWVQATPEEQVRQRLIRTMLEERGFSAGLMGVEVSLAELTGRRDLPLRRVDLVVYGKRSSGLQPLLVIECKAVPIGAAALEQVQSYNYFLQCPFWGVANADEVRIGWHSASGWCWRRGLPSYSALRTSLN